MKGISKVLLKKRTSLTEQTAKKNVFLIGGGGTRGIFAVGVLKYLFEDNPHYRLQDTSIFGGTSVGSFLAAALSLGFTKDDIMVMSKMVNLSDLVDSKWKFVVTAYRLFRQGHFYDDSGRQKISENILNYRIDAINTDLGLNNKITGKDLTFGHLKTLINTHPDIYKHLLVNAVDISRGQQIFMTTLNDKWLNIKLIDALMASSAIPFVYKPVDIFYYQSLDQYGYLPIGVKNQLTSEIEGLECEWYDGGVSTNDPTDYFLINHNQYQDYHLWLLNFTHDNKYDKPTGIVSKIIQIINYLVSGKNNIKMELVYEAFKINTISLHTTGGTFDTYTPEQIQQIINDTYEQCVSGKINPT